MFIPEQMLQIVGRLPGCRCHALNVHVMIKRGKAEKSVARSKRLAAALRENLRRRKAQAKGRAHTSAPVPEGEDFAANGATMETISGAPPDFRRNQGRE
jgi:hypothetical protein